MQNDPAFPSAEKQADGTHRQSHLGLSKREELAGRAMQGILANSKMVDEIFAAAKETCVPPDALLTQCAVDFTDALLKVLSK